MQTLWRIPYGYTKLKYVFKQTYKLPTSLHMQNDNAKKSLKPLPVEMCFPHASGKKPMTIRSNSDSELVTEISRESQSNILPTITDQYFPEYKKLKWKHHLETK